MKNSNYFNDLFSDTYFFPVIVLILVAIGACMFIMRMRWNLDHLKPGDGVSEKEMEWEKKESRVLFTQIIRVIWIITSIISIGYFTYIGVRGTPMQGHLLEWLNLFVRWGHVIAGVMWIGASFYFIFLENNLNRTEGIREELAGNLWAIHGGGFYFLEKYKVAPKSIPKDLHWFKYEAYFTWITGFALLWIVYYMDAKAFLIDPQVMDISVPVAIMIGIGTLLFGWIGYVVLCKALLKMPNLFAIVGFLLLIGVAYGLSQVFGSRAAYIHVGALIGTIMAWNVYFVIIPSQKAMVKAAFIGEKVDPRLGPFAQQRSLHNNYLTLPVIFIMISNHFPSTFGNEYSWIILIAISLASAGIKHYWNLIERGQRAKYILPVSVVAMFALVYVTRPKEQKLALDAKKVQFSEIQTMMTQRCNQCHSSAPTDDKWTAAPNGVMFDDPEQISKYAERIMVRAVQTKTMPQGNKTNMTDAERETLKNWILQGAKTNE